MDRSGAPRVAQTTRQSEPLPPRRVAVLQSNYIPWKGYFDLIHDVDLFLFYDDVQYTRQDWRNRNRIKTASGTEWLSIPVGTSLQRRICDVEVKDPSWQVRHWRKLCQSYEDTPFFGAYRSFLEEVYNGTRWESLSGLNQFLIRTIARDHLGIRTELTDSRQLAAVGQREDRLLDLLTRAGATVYVSGPAARSYIHPERFEAAGIELVWKDYAGYPEYPQVYPPFVHQVTVLDLLFHVGPAAPEYIWGWRGGRG